MKFVQPKQGHKRGFMGINGTDNETGDITGTNGFGNKVLVKRHSSGANGSSVTQLITRDMLNQAKSLNVQQERDLDEMFATVPELFNGMEATRGWAFCHPPTVKWKKLQSVMGPDFKFILERYYMKFRWESYLEWKKYGIVAYKYRDVGGWRVPFVIMRGHGTIKQYYDHDTEQMVYMYFKNSTPDASFDPEVRFKVFYAPNAAGHYKSPAMSALRDYKMTKAVYRGAERTVHQTSRMPLFMVHTPPKIRPGDERVQVDFGDDEELDENRRKYNNELEKGYMARNALDDAIRQSDGANRGRRGMTNGASGPGFVNHSPLLNSESLADVQQREGNDLMDRFVYLDDHWNVVSVAPPPLPVDPLAYATRVGQVCAALVDFPMSMVIEQHAQHAGNFNAQITFSKDRMKEIIFQMNSFLKDVIFDAERERFQRIFRETAEELSEVIGGPLSEETLMEMYRDITDFEVDQQCTPLVTLEQVTELWNNCVIDQKTYGEQALHALGVPQHHMSVTPVKRPLEIETERFELEKKVAENGIKMANESMKLEKKKVDQAGEVAEEGIGIEKKKLKQAGDVAEKHNELEHEKLKVAAAKPKPKPAGGGAKKKSK